MVATVWGDLTLKVPHKAAAARVSRENWVMIRAMQTGQKARTLATPCRPHGVRHRDLDELDVLAVIQLGTKPTIHLR